MIQVKRVLFTHRKRKDGNYPVQIRVTGERLSNYHSTGIYVAKNQWDEKEMMVVKHPKQEELNKIIMDAYMALYDLALDDKIKNLQQTAAQIKMRYEKWLLIKGRGSQVQDVKDVTVAPVTGSVINNQGKGTDSPVAISEQIYQAEREEQLAQGANRFFLYADNYLEELKGSGKFSRHAAEVGRFGVMKDFCIKQGLSGVRFEDVSTAFIRALMSYLKQERKVGERTIMNYLVCIRTVFNRAVAENIVDPKYYPFGKAKIKIKMPEGNKIGLNEEEVKKLEGLELETDTPGWHALNVWLLSFYFAGIRISDTIRLAWTDFTDARIYYVMGKNNKKVSLKTPDRVQKILEKYLPYHDHYQGYIFPYLKNANLDDPEDIFKKARSGNRTINAELEEIRKTLEIEKKISMHISRHSFGNISGDKISPQMLQKLYRHSSITTTMGYQSNFIHKDADDALDTVLNF